MLKHLSKTLLIAIISSVMITSPVLAEDAPKSVVMTDEQGNKSARTTHKFQGIKDEDMIASIVMLATGVIAARLLIKYKKPTTDMMIAAAGGAAFIAGEVMSNMKFKGTMEEKTVDVITKRGMTANQEQIDIIQKLRESYEEAKKTTKTKKTLQLAAAAAFTAAAAMAGYMAYTEYSAVMACQTALNSSSIALKACIKAGTAASVTGYGAKEAAACLACEAPLIQAQSALPMIEKERVSPSPSAKEFVTISALQKATLGSLSSATGICAPGEASKAAAASFVPACTAALNLESLNQIFSYNPAALSSNDLLNKILYPEGQPVFSYEQMQSRELDLNLFEKGMNFLFPTAQASWLPMLGLAGGAALGYFGASYTGLAVQTDMFMFVPFNRIIAWGTLAGLSFLASKSSDNTIKKLDENISKIDKILLELRSLQKAIATQNVKPVGIEMRTVDPQSQIVAPYSANNSAKSQCMNSNATSDCQSLEEQLKAVPGFTQLPGAFQTMATQSTRMADGLSGATGISSGAMNNANALAAKHGAINNILKKRQAGLNDLLKKSGKKGINFDKEQDKFYKGMAGSVRKALRGQGTTASGFMASIGGSPINSSEIGKPIAADENKTAAVVGSEGVAPSPVEEKDEIDLAFDEAPAPAVAEAAGYVADEYDVKTDEIHKDDGPSIFELISSRYLKSGYPKLLDEEPAKN